MAAEMELEAFVVRKTVTIQFHANPRRDPIPV
jgi:hypothetical protein